jgi:hypothetical protein
MVTEKYFDNNMVAKGRDGKTVILILMNIFIKISER